MTDASIQLIFLALVITGLVGIAWLISMKWRKVAAVYPSQSPCSGRRWFFRSGVIAGTKVGGMLVVGADLRGAYFSMVFPFSLFAPTLMVPWSELSGVERKGILVRFVELKFGRVTELRNEISGRLADKLESSSGGVWRYERTSRTVIIGRD